MIPVAIGLGSNLEDPVRNVREAAVALHEVLRDCRVSSLYRSSPMYLENQSDFINAVVFGFTTFSPRNLLLTLKEMESRFGRVASVVNGPRRIDLDLLLYGALAYRFEFGDGRTLGIPHQRMDERRFVIEPLFEIDPELIVPGRGTVRGLMNQEFEGQRLERVSV